ncbi:MAG: tyrosyl-tRNA synthetase [Bacteroidetes bacterium OLB9]|nr:MAG: tyrosyl-tRNA synthetase [Bacteroidetes bacterium OLB9]MCZ2337832.1 tyrosine--tRNA ligase [Chitinophagales bacterium]
MLNFIDELKWRGMLHDMTPGAAELLNSQKVVGYIGFDPTAPSLTIGNYVQIMLLKMFQLSGHRPIVLMGGATGRIGDPSFKDKERELKSYDEIETNLAFQKEQFKKFIDFEGPNGAILLNNYDFYKEMNILEFLRDVGKTLTVSYMMSKDSVKTRLETGLSFTEFTYQLLQAYDFQLLFDKYDCVVQMGGSDQWGNITSGTEFIRRNIDGKAYAITTPLLTKADGTKFGKSEQGNIWLDPKLTSPYQFYQFWLNADDADLPKFMRYFTLKSREEVEAIEAEYKDDPRRLKAILAEELTRRVHSDEDFVAVSQVSQLLFGKGVSHEELVKMTPIQFDTIGQEIPCYQLSEAEVMSGLNIVDMLSNLGILSSKSEARKAIQGNAIAVNKVKSSNHEQTITSDDFIHGRYMMIENGKKNKFLIKKG